MPENNNKNYNPMQSLITRDILRVTQKQSDLQQYRLSSIPSHSHNNLDSLPVPYPALKGVRNYLISNTLTLSSAQIKALHTTPIVLIANPGPKSFVYVDSVAARLVFGTTAYTGTNGLHFTYTNSAGIPVCGDIPASFINSSENAYAMVPSPIDTDRNLNFEFTPVGGDVGNNGQIVVSTLNANPATGDGTITIVAHYRIVSFAA